MALAATTGFGGSPAGTLHDRYRVAGVHRVKPERRDGILLELGTLTWPHLFRHRAATSLLEDSDDDTVFVRDQLVHRNIRETLHRAYLSDTERIELALGMHQA